MCILNTPGKDLRDILDSQALLDCWAYDSHTLRKVHYINLRRMVSSISCENNEDPAIRQWPVFSLKILQTVDVFHTLN